MAHVTEKNSFRAIQLGQCFRALSFLSICRCVGDGSSDMTCNQIKEGAIFCIVDSSRAHTRNKEPYRPILPGICLDQVEQRKRHVGSVLCKGSRRRTTGSPSPLRLRRTSTQIA